MGCLIGCKPSRKGRCDLSGVVSEPNPTSRAKGWHKTQSVDSLFFPQFAKRESAADLPTAATAEVEASGKPNFSGHWVLERTEGDVDTFLADMQQARYIRWMAKNLKYGVGKVVVKCEVISAESLQFAKTLTD